MSQARRTFENRRAALRHIARLSPNRVSMTDIAELNNTTVRTTQGTLRDLTVWGYLIHDNCNPRGYRFNEDKRGDLM